MKKTSFFVLTALLAAGMAWSQPGPGGGQGPATGSATGQVGQGARAGSDYTPGWSMMNSAERKEHQERMQSMKTYEECKAYAEQHHAEMKARAKERGGAVMMQPRRDPCAGMKR